VKQVTLLGRTLPAESQGKTGPTFSFTAVEHCEDDHRSDRALTGAGASSPESAKLIDLPKAEVTDLAALAADGALVVSPELSASAIVRQVMTEVVRPVKAQIIHEERVELGMIDLYFRPVYAFEFHWAAKGKRAVVECDGLSGELKLGGPTIKDHLRSILNRDMLFDISAEAVGMVVPGGGIAVKLTKAAMDLKKR
jgi:hypothetical protein